MPLRDHFHPNELTGRKKSWGGVHAAWPTLIVIALNETLPPKYEAEPSVHLGSIFEVDIAALEDDHARDIGGGDDGGTGVATAVWAPPRPTLMVATDVSGQDDYEVRIVDVEDSRRVVAAIEIISPSNKDRPEHRSMFAAKCATLLQQGVSLSLVDVVTDCDFNLYGQALELLGQTDPALKPVAPPIYAAACRWRQTRGGGRLEAWFHELAVGQHLPMLPLWLDVDLAMPLPLEATYEQTCRALRLR